QNRRSCWARYGPFRLPCLCSSPSYHGHQAFLLAEAGDEEKAEVWHDLRPDVTPPEAAGGKTGANPKEQTQPELRKEEGSRSGDVEEREMKDDGLNVPK